MATAPSDQAVGFYDTVQGEELKEVAASRARRGQPLVNNNLIGLAFSGGGIRSATFNLGILQGLAHRGFLKQIDFISTVSGGGYIGAWLVAWIRRCGCKPVEKRLAQNSQPGPEAERYLEPDQVRFLRKHSMYLAPRSGLLSADIWTAAAIYLRNLILNLTLLVAFGFAVLLIPDLVLAEVRLHPNPSDSVLLIFLLVMLIAGAFAAVVIGVGMSGLSDDPPQTGWKAFVLRHVGVLISVSLFVTAASGAVLMASSLQRDLPNKAEYLVESAVVYFLFWLIAAGTRKSIEKKRLRPSGERDANPRPLVEGRKGRTWTICSTLASGVLVGFLVYSLVQLLRQAGYAATSADTALCVQALLLVFSPPLLIVALMVTAVFHMGSAGRALPDAKREWAARAAAILSLFTLGYAALFAAAIYGPLLMKWIFYGPWFQGFWGKAGKWLLGAAWVAISGGGVLAGKSSSTNGSNGKLGLLTKVAPPVFMVGSVLLLSFALDSILRQTTSSSLSANVPPAANVCCGPSDPQPAPELEAAADRMLAASDFRQLASAAQSLDQSLHSTHPANSRSLLAEHFDRMKGYLDPNLLGRIFFLCLALTLIFMACVDVNEFSMHLFYRNRLVRAYLGASQTRRVSDSFTGFGKDDDVGLEELTNACVKTRVPLDLAKDTELEYDEDEKGHIAYDLPYDGPYPIFCTALNLVRGKELAWQKRKSASFVFTPLFCGYDRFEYHHGLPQKYAAAAYRPTKDFSRPGGPRVGTAIAISGAAASPNMGYHTSPALGFMMAIFNVRLGWWAGNPRHPRTWRRPGPWWGLLYMLRELFPSTTDEMAYVYLSDGGHFENLGIYELVRRKCRYIIASDADCDPCGTFENLGNAVEKCRRDFGVDIDICMDELRRDPATGLSSAPYVIGKIGYRDAPPGFLLFIKSTLIADLSADVFAYGAQNREFPFDSTGNQFFDESQFESYRSLGQQIMSRIIEKGGEDTLQLPTLIESLESMSRAG